VAKIDGFESSGIFIEFVKSYLEEIGKIPIILG